MSHRQPIGGFVATVAHANLSTFLKQSAAAERHADWIEWRLDTLTHLDLQALAKQRPTLPLIATLRPAHQRGGFTDDPYTRANTLKQVVACLAPKALDVEIDVIDILWPWLQNHAPDVRVVLSHHQWDHMPDRHDLECQLDGLAQRPHHAVKYAAMAQRDVAALRLMAASLPHDHLTAIAMGEHGQSSRLLSPYIRNVYHYYSAGTQAAAPGQMWIGDAKRSVNPHTAVYGLLGDPVALSVGDRFHQQILEQQSRDALYWKWQINPHELSEAMACLAELGIQGLSITTPLKEHILTHLNHHTEEVRAMHACNTLTRQHGAWYGDNTDGPGGVACLKPYQTSPPRACHILGLGGTARALAIACAQAGWPVVLYGRDPSKITQLIDHADHRGGISVRALTDFQPSSHAIVINTIPSQTPDFPTHLGAYLQRNMVFLDCVYQPQCSPLTEIAGQQGCTLIRGESLFEAQAHLQQARWAKALPCSHTLSTHHMLADAAIPGLALFHALGTLQTFSDHQPTQAQLQQADVLLVRSVTRVDATLLANTAVRYVGSVTAGTDHIDAPYLASQGITWVHAPGCNASAVADYVLACIAACTQAHRLHTPHPQVGVIGAGHAGTAVGERCAAMGWQVVYHDPLRAERETAFQHSTLHAMHHCDVITIHAALHDDPPYPSRHLLGASFFKQLKPGCVLINSSRGDVLKESDLDALPDAHTLCLDVWSQEPSINPHTLAATYIATPHIAGHTQEAKMHATRQVYDALASLLGQAQPTTTKVHAKTAPDTMQHDDAPWYDTLLKQFNPLHITQAMHALQHVPPSERATGFQQWRRTHRRHALKVSTLCLDIIG